VTSEGHDTGSARWKLLTPEEVATWLGVDREWVYRKARQRKLPAIKVGKFWRFREEALQAWIVSQERGER
jgi:excisionase family DNA binding protein